MSRRLADRDHVTPEATEWFALLRAHEGGVTKLARGYVNHGGPVVDYLAETFGSLVNNGLQALGQPDPKRSAAGGEDFPMSGALNSPTLGGC